MLQPCDLAECFRYLKQLLKLHETKAATEKGALAAVAKITAEFGAKDAAAAVAAAGGAAPELVLVGAPPPMAILAEGSPHHPVTRSLSDGLKNAPEGPATLSKLKLLARARARAPLLLTCQLCVIASPLYIPFRSVVRVPLRSCTCNKSLIVFFEVA